MDRLFPRRLSTLFRIRSLRLCFHLRIFRLFTTFAFPTTRHGIIHVILKLATYENDEGDENDPDIVDKYLDAVRRGRAEYLSAASPQSVVNWVYDQILERDLVRASTATITNDSRETSEWAGFDCDPRRRVP